LGPFDFEYLRRNLHLLGASDQVLTISVGPFDCELQCLHQEI
jgi:hypothetical protein